MTKDEIFAYVRTMAAAINLQLDEARARNVAVHLGRIFGMVEDLKNMPLAPEQEMAEIFRPAPFPLMADAKQKA